MFRRIIICLLLAVVLLTVSSAEAQQAQKVPRIGFLATNVSSPPQAFVQGLHELGYFESKNIAFEFRTTEGKPERYVDREIFQHNRRVKRIGSAGKE
jgi:hypothetical protein